MCPRGRVLRQSDRQVRDRRARRRRRPDRPQDHRRHLWRRGPARRRRLLGQGPDQGRPLGRLCRALSGQERGGGRPRRALRDPALLRDRRLQAALDLCRHLRHRPRSTRCGWRQVLQRGDEPEPARHPRASRAQPADLRPHLGLRPFRPRAARPTAASPGSGPTSPTSCAAPSTERRRRRRPGAAGCRRSTAAARARGCGPARRRLLDERCRELAVALPEPGRSIRARCSRAGRARSGSRSASAAASIWRPRPRRIPRSASSASSRSSTASPGCCGRSRPSGLRQCPRPRRRCAPAAAGPAGRLRRARLRPVPRPLAEAAPPQAADRQSADRGRARPGAGAGRRAAARHRRSGLCPLDAGSVCWPSPASPGWPSGPRDWRERAGRLAGDPLRGQGAGARAAGPIYLRFAAACRAGLSAARAAAKRLAARGLGSAPYTGHILSRHALVESGLAPALFVLPSAQGRRPFNEVS